MTRDRAHFLLLNMGHFLDHLFTLIFATVAALALSREWGVPYDRLLLYAGPGFFAFGAFALPAGWIADRWSRDAMMVVFFVGIGFAAILAAQAQSPFQIGLGLFVLGIFAAIYHPVGLAIVSMRWKNTGMRIAANGVWGNLGVAGAALIAGFFIDHGGWRMAFVVPGIVSVLAGLAYGWLRWHEIVQQHRAPRPAPAAPMTPQMRGLFLRVSAIVFVTAAVSSIIYQSTTFALPKVLDERLQGLAARLTDGDLATLIGALAFTVFAVASMAQLVVGLSLDRFGARPVFMVAAAIQMIFFAAMPGLTDGPALAVALGFMLGAFGQIPITDYMIGKMASGAARARVYAVRYVVSFTVLAATLPMISVVYGRWGFDTLFVILAGAAAVILLAVAMLPRKLPVPVTAE